VKPSNSEALPGMRSIVSRRVRSGGPARTDSGVRPIARWRGREKGNSKVRQIGASWWCESCGVIHDRDRNAAINLKTVAARRSGTAAFAAVTACGEQGSGVGPVAAVKPVSVNQEPEREASRLFRSTESSALIGFERAGDGAPWWTGHCARLFAQRRVCPSYRTARLLSPASPPDEGRNVFQADEVR
jgi:hypothetical protein